MVYKTKRRGFQCHRCGSITLTFRNTLVSVCPQCGGRTWKAGHLNVYTVSARDIRVNNELEARRK